MNATDCSCPECDANWPLVYALFGAICTMLAALLVYNCFDPVWRHTHGEGFCIGNILKYSQRYGKKEGKNRADLLKVLHYALIALHVHDQES